MPTVVVFMAVPCGFGVYALSGRLREAPPVVVVVQGASDIDPDVLRLIDENIARVRESPRSAV